MLLVLVRRYNASIPNLKSNAVCFVFRLRSKLNQRVRPHLYLKAEIRFASCHNVPSCYKIYCTPRLLGAYCLIIMGSNVFCCLLSCCVVFGVRQDKDHHCHTVSAYNLMVYLLYRSTAAHHSFHFHNSNILYCLLLFWPVSEKTTTWQINKLSGQLWKSSCWHIFVLVSDHN